MRTRGKRLARILVDAHDLLLPMAVSPRAAVCLAVLLSVGAAACDSGAAADRRTLTDDALAERSAGMSTTVSGHMVYLDRQADGHHYRMGLNLAWGGAITEVSVDGVNTVNADDPGREIQIALYEGGGRYDLCAGCSGSWGWNPVQGGDRHGHGSPAAIVDRQAGGVHVRVQPLEWFPDDKGGGRSRGVPSDVQLDLFMSSVQEHPAGFRVHYVVTHLGRDRHASTVQELPAVYPLLGFDRYVYYGGPAPWTGALTAVIDAVSPLETPPWQGRDQTETWGSHVDATGEGVTVYVPGAYGHSVGFRLDQSVGGRRIGTNYFHLTAALGLEPGEVREGDYYVFAGAVGAARDAIAALHAAEPPGDLFPPFGFGHTPREGDTVAGTVAIRGIAMDDTGVERVEVLLDGAPLGAAQTALPSPELGVEWSALGARAGYAFAWDTRAVADGPHRLGVRIADAAGHVAEYESAVVVANGAGRSAAPPAGPTPLQAPSRDRAGRP